jgi:hypothetical protein
LLAFKEVLQRWFENNKPALAPARKNGIAVRENGKTGVLKALRSLLLSEDSAQSTGAGHRFCERCNSRMQHVDAHFWDSGD